MSSIHSLRKFFARKLHKDTPTEPELCLTHWNLAK